MRDKAKERVLSRLRKKRRIHKKIHGTAERPRIAVYRSLKHFYAQIVDDDAGKTLVAASTLTPDIREQLKTVKTKTEKGKIVGEYLAKKALEKGITKVVFDRSGYVYHGRVKAFADGARSGGLKF